MKKQLKNIFSFFLAAAILFASTGVVIASHICMESKKADVSLFERDGCCSTAGDDCSSFPTESDHLKNNCCQLSISYHKLEINSFEKTSPLFSICIFPAAHDLFQIMSAKSTSHIDFPPQPSVESGMDILLNIQKLLI